MILKLLVTMNKTLVVLLKERYSVALVHTYKAIFDYFDKNDLEYYIVE